MPKHFSIYSILSVVFVEGAAVMVAELTAGMLVAPFFGTSLISWALVLSITLLGLASGYFLGGILAAKKNIALLFTAILFLGGVLCALIPILGSVVMPIFMDWNLELGLAASLLIFLFPTLVCFGSMGPLAVALLSYYSSKAGRFTGMVYALSTIGGIIATLVFGLLLIPNYGILIPCFITGSLVSSLAAIIAIQSKRMFWVATIVYLILGFSWVREKSQAESSTGPMKVLHSSSGIMGEVKVVDFPWKVSHSNEVVLARALTVNGVWQTAVSLKDGTSILNYVYHVLPLVQKYPQESEILVVGLGGGGLVGEMERKGYKPLVVEIDERLPELTKSYFSADLTQRVVVDDGRHFLNKSSRQFEIIILDVFQGETPPWHLLTLETFKSVKACLKPNGMFIIEFFGGVEQEGNEAQAFLSVLKTLKKAGLLVKVVQVEDRENVIIASKKEINLRGVGYSGNTFVPKPIDDLSQHEISLNSLDLSKAKILTDDLPILEKMSYPEAKQWRRYQNKIFRDNFIRQGISLL